MTIFDTLRYPIGDQIQLQVLENMPPELVESICEEMNRKHIFKGIELSQLMRRVILEWNTK